MIFSLKLKDHNCQAVDNVIVLDNFAFFIVFMTNCGKEVDFCQPTDQPILLLN